jgi:hypothetical protein
MVIFHIYIYMLVYQRVPRRSFFHFPPDGMEDMKCLADHKMVKNSSWVSLPNVSTHFHDSEQNFEQQIGVMIQFSIITFRHVCLNKRSIVLYSGESVIVPIYVFGTNIPVCCEYLQMEITSKYPLYWPLWFILPVKLFLHGYFFQETLIAWQLKYVEMVNPVLYVT